MLIFRSLSGLAVGAAGLYGYAFKLTHLVYLPTATLTAVVFPHLARSHAAKDPKAFSNILARSARMIVFVAVPSAAVCWALRLVIVEDLFGGGALTGPDLTLIGELFGTLVFASPMGVLMSLVTKSCASRHRTVAPFAGSCAAVLAAAILLAVLPARFGAPGVAATWVAASGVQLAVTVLWARLRAQYLVSARTLGYLGRILAISLGGALAATLWARFLPPLSSALVGSWPGLLLLGTLSAMSLFGLALAFRLPEAQDFTRLAAAQVARALGLNGNARSASETRSP